MSVTIDEQALERLRGLLEKATPGEWRQWRLERSSTLIVIDGEDPQRIVSSGRTGDDAALIVAMKNTLPDLFARIASDAKRIKEMREALEPFVERLGDFIVRKGPVDVTLAMAFERARAALGDA